MLTIEDFKKPNAHPFSMLAGMGLEHTSEAESFMAWCLSQCIQAKDFAAKFTTRHNEDWLIRYDLLKKVGKQTYQLTQKAKGLLYVHYGTA